MQLETKRCPECGEEFIHTAVRCSDCGVDLMLNSELATEPGATMPLAAELVLLRAEGPAWIEALAAKLADRGIDSRVEIIDPEALGAKTGTGGAACGLFVRPQDVSRAREIDAAVQRDQIPDIPIEGVVGDGSGDHCPACGSQVSPDATECPECELFLG